VGPGALDLAGAPAAQPSVETVADLFRNGAFGGAGKRRPKDAAR
jgi:hypothetical protein